MKFTKCIISLFLFANFISAQSVGLDQRDAEVWSRYQTITGQSEEPGNLIVNSQVIPFETEEGSFSIPIILDEGENKIYAESDSAGVKISTDTLIYTLMYDLLPEVYAYAEVEGRTISLQIEVLDNPKELDLKYEWYTDDTNPLELNLQQNGTSASADIPSDAETGEYYFRLRVITSEDDTVKFGTYVTVDSNSIEPFDIKNDYAAWIDSAVIYEVTPYIFVNHGEFKNITKKIPELKEFGINTLWIQPVMETYGEGQGYDITNYFKVRSDLGPEEDLRELVNTAKEYGMRVLFDFVANHSSSAHRYARNAIEYGKESHYYNFYKRNEDNAPYSQHYEFTTNGFMYYFWPDLWLYNFDNPEVQKWIIEAAKYWIEEYDIDGYRFDAIWGPNARAPQFTKDLRLALKRIKPEALLLAEDKATWPETFDERFDVGYDWFPEESWVSHWVWQTDYSPTSNPTIFNRYNQNTRALQLRNSLTNFGNGYADDAKILRFMENNDVFHFITHHSLEQTKMVAALMFSLNGIPLIYNGQEIGIEGHPYETEYIFYNGFSIESRDFYDLFPYYKRLIEIRKNNTALFSDNYEEINIEPDSYTFAFRRWNENQQMVSIINMGDIETDVTLALPVEEMNLDSRKNLLLYGFD